MSNKDNATRIIVLSLVIACILAIFPLPNIVNWLRPQWVLLVLIYWGLVFPGLVNVGIAWVAGIILDILLNASLGEHALIYVVTMYIAVRFYTRARFFPFWQKWFVVLSLVLVSYMMQFWIESLLGRQITYLVYWAGVLTTALFWPVVCILFNHWLRNISGEKQL